MHFQPFSKKNLVKKYFSFLKVVIENLFMFVLHYTCSTMLIYLVAINLVVKIKLIILPFTFMYRSLLLFLLREARWHIVMSSVSGSESPRFELDED